MSLERLDGNDTKVLLIWILAGLLGAGVAYKYFFQAFPEASVEFKVPRAAALEQAKQFAAAQGAQLGGYDSSIVFDVDDTAKTYLEREVGLEQANQMMTNDVHIWYWQTRFFRPLQKEEFDVRVDPAGGVVGYTHELEEAAPGARLERAAAQAVAESFLRDTLHADLSRYDFREEEANFTERPNRRDWSFSWERRGFRAKDAPYRLNVTLAGDRVNGYVEFLKVPEAWKLDYERLRSSNNLFEYIALIPYAFLLGGCLYLIVSLGRQGLLEWRTGLALGIFLTALYFLMTMNQWPLDRAGYDTNTPYSSFFLSQVGQAVLISVVSAFLVVLAVVPGEPLYRISQPDKIRLEVGFRLPGIRTKEFFRANVIGICLAAAHIGYITVFYIISRKLGAWAPQDLNYENVVSTSLPWVYPLAIGIYAATSEEFLFRLFAIPYLMRITKSRFLAVVLPAFAWGFLHSNYPQEPAYIRGIEVGLIGIVAGLVMLRWGIWATLIWHYTVDAFLISTSLLRSNGAYLRVSGAIVGGAALIPLAIAAISYISRGGFTADPQLLNSARPLGGPPVEIAPEAATEVRPETIPESAASDTAPAYTAMSSRALATLIACGVLGAALLVGVKREAIGDFVRFQIDAKEATARADQVLRENKIDPASYQHAATVTYTFDGYTNEYLRRTIGIAAANRVYRDQVPSAFWTVRYFRDSQNEEYMVVLRPDGSLHSLHHTLDEKTPGANLSKEEARARAEAYLRDQKKADLSGWNLVETNTDKKPARTDHVFEWEQKTALDAGSGQQGAHVRMQVQVQGDEVSGYRVFIKIPEAWRDAESRTTAAQLAQTFRQGDWHCRGPHYGAGDLSAQPETSGNRARSVAQAGPMVGLGVAGRHRDFCEPHAANSAELHDDVAAQDVLRHSFHLIDFYHGALSGGCGPAAGPRLVFSGARIRPRTNPRVGRNAGRVLQGCNLRGGFWRGGGDGTESLAGIIFALAAVAPHAGGCRARRPGWAEPCGGRRCFRDFRQFFYHGTSRSGRGSDCRVCASPMDALGTLAYLRSADGDQRGDAGGFLKGCGISPGGDCRVLVWSNPYRSIQYDGLFLAGRDDRAGSRRHRIHRAAQSLFPRKWLRRSRVYACDARLAADLLAPQCSPQRERLGLRHDAAFFRRMASLRK